MFFFSFFSSEGQSICTKMVLIGIPRKKGKKNEGGAGQLKKGQRENLKAEQRALLFSLWVYAPKQSRSVGVVMTSFLSLWAFEQF